MDNGTVKKRDMKEAMKNVNERATPWWPVVLFFGSFFVIIWILLLGLIRTIQDLFKQKKSFRGKVVLITGAGRGLGRSVAIKLAKMGAQMACVDINSKTNEETVELIKKDGGIAQAFTCNVAKSQSVDDMRREIIAKMGPVDVVVNNAALVMGMTLKEMTYADIRGMFEVNCMGPIFVTRAFLDDMVERNSGHIVAISSIAAMSSGAYITLYNSTKSAISRFFDSARVELNDTIRDNKVKVTVIHPFFVNTSADYASWFQTFFPILTENYVADCIVDAMEYEKESVAVPSALSFVKITDALFGSYQYNVVLKLIGKNIKTPTKQERDQMPYATIVSDISNSTG